MVLDAIVPGLHERMLGAGSVGGERGGTMGDAAKGSSATVGATGGVTGEALARLLLSGHGARARELVRAAIGDGASATEMILSVFVDASRLMGDQWLADDASFSEVSVGLVDLHMMLRDCESALEDEVPRNRNARTAMVVALSPDEHLFGAAILETFLRSAGWMIAPVADRTNAAVIEECEKVHVDLVGISVVEDRNLDECKALIGHLRERSRNRDVRVMVGGRPFLEEPGRVGYVGADGTADDALSALALAAALAV